MKIGVPKEIKVGEKRVALTPQGADALIHHGHKVFLGKGAGTGSGFDDEEYLRAGAVVVEKPEAVWEEADLIVKVKEPLEREFPLMRAGQILFTYLHLAANLALTRKLVERRVIAIGYETVQEADGQLPLLRPMSEIAGRASVLAGASCLEARQGGRGVLLSGASGVPPAKVVILGGGVAGFNAGKVSLGLGAQTWIFDLRPERLSYLHDVTQGRVITCISSRLAIEKEIAEADLVIGAVLIPGAKAPKLVSRQMMRKMRPGSAIVDISVDQGGCFETTRPTTHENPTYIEEEIVHYAVANIPGAYPRTSTLALTNVTLPPILQIADLGYAQALRGNEALGRGLNVFQGELICPGVASGFGMPCTANPFLRHSKAGGLSTCAP